LANTGDYDVASAAINEFSFARGIGMGKHNEQRRRARLRRKPTRLRGVAPRRGEVEHDDAPWHPSAIVEGFLKTGFDLERVAFGDDLAQQLMGGAVRFANEPERDSHPHDISENKFIRLGREARSRTPAKQNSGGGEAQPRLVPNVTRPGAGKRVCRTAVYTHHRGFLSMRQQVITVFDEFVPSGVTAYTSAQFNSALGAADQLGIQAIVDNGTGAGTLDIFLETSNDGRNWIQRNDQSTTTPTGTGDFHFVTASTGSQTLMYSDPGATVSAAAATHTNSGSSPAPVTNSPFLAFVRLRVVAASAGTHVKIHAALRGPR
jgi:hypothetical protein